MVTETKLKPRKIEEEVQRRFYFNQSETSKIVTDMAERIQTAVLKKICGYSAEESQIFSKNYHGDISNEIINALISGICELNPLTLPNNSREIENALRFYADAENYEEQEYRTPHCHSWWETPLVKKDKGKRAKAILEKYFDKE